jgi:hypothetical protein
LYVFRPGFRISFTYLSLFSILRSSLTGFHLLFSPSPTKSPFSERSEPLEPSRSSGTLVLFISGRRLLLIWCFCSIVRRCHDFSARSGFGSGSFSGMFWISAVAKLSHVYFRTATSSHLLFLILSFAGDAVFRRELGSVLAAFVWLF